MESHQKYFPIFNDKDEITNEFLIVSNKKDEKGLIKIGNETLIEHLFKRIKKGLCIRQQDQKDGW